MLIMQKLQLGRASAENRVEISHLGPVAIMQLIVDQSYFPASPSWSTGCELFESARAAFSFFNDAIMFFSTVGRAIHIVS